MYNLQATNKLAQDTCSDQHSQQRGAKLHPPQRRLGETWSARRHADVLGGRGRRHLVLLLGGDAAALVHTAVAVVLALDAVGGRERQKASASEIIFGVGWVGCVPLPVGDGKRGLRSVERGPGWGLGLRVEGVGCEV